MFNFLLMDAVFEVFFLEDSLPFRTKIEKNLLLL